MSSRLFFINVMLVIFIAVETFMVIGLWTSMDNVILPDKNSPGKIEKFENKKLNTKHVSPISAYGEITRLNLFSEERQEYMPEILDVEPEQEPEKPIETLKTNKIILFGIVVMGEYRKALVADIDNNSKRDSIWIKKGDILDDFRVDSIEKDRIVVSNNGESYSVLLYDDKNPKKREFVQIPKAVKNKEIQISKPLVPVLTKKKNIKKEIIEDEYEIVSTPFGEFKRKKKK